MNQQTLIKETVIPALKKGLAAARAITEEAGQVMFNPYALDLMEKALKKCQDSLDGKGEITTAWIEETADIEWMFKNTIRRFPDGSYWIVLSTGKGFGQLQYDEVNAQFTDNYPSSYQARLAAKNYIKHNPKGMIIDNITPGVH